MLAFYVDYNSRERLPDGGQGNWLDGWVADIAAETIHRLAEGEFEELRAATKRMAIRIVK